MLVLLLIGCNAASIALEDADTRIEGLDTASTDTTGDTAADVGDDTGADTDTDTGGDTAQDTAAPVDTEDTAADTALDTAIDTGEPVEDTAPPPCEGFTFDVAEVTVSSTVDSDAEVTLSGCATGIWGGPTSVDYSGYFYEASWASLPASVDGEASATLHFDSAPRAIETWLVLTVHSDQGDLTLTVHATP